MSTSRRVAAVAAIVAVAVALASPGVANADNSNTNTNNNDVTNVGDPSDMFVRSKGNTDWPPAGLSWPPNGIDSGGENGGAGAAPIVMPTGKPAPTKAATARSETATPIVPGHAS